MVGELSGGERARLLLGKVALEETNLLLLDEPTNHLDIAQEVLETPLLGYGGAIVLVTHDRALIDAVATRTWSIEDGGIREVLGGYTDLLRLREREKRDREREARTPPTPSAPQVSRPAPAANPSGSRAIRRLEEEIAATEAELELARTRLLDPDTFADAQTGAEAGRAHDRLSGAASPSSTSAGRSWPGPPERCASYTVGDEQPDASTRRNARRVGIDAPPCC